MAARDKDKIMTIEIPGFNSKYLVSDVGAVFNKSGKKLYVSIDKHGYPRVALYKNGRRSGYTVHRLVCNAFLPNPDNKPVVNHKNGIRTDNRIENLEWCTVSENVLHGFKMGRVGKTAKGEAAPHHILKEKDIPEIRKMLSSGELSLKEIGARYGVSLHTIYSVKSGKNWNHIQ